VTKENILTKELLQKEYVKLGKSCSVIAKEISDKTNEKITKQAVLWWIHKHKIKSRPSGFSKKDITGKRYGSLVVLERWRKTKNRDYKWKCLCDCGAITYVWGTSLTAGQKWCWLCSRQRISEASWEGYGEISKGYWSRLKRSAEERKYSFEITTKYAWDVFLSQKRKCALSGMPIYFQARRIKRGQPRDQTASLDRIDSEKGYVEGNVQWVHKDINRIKWHLSVDHFIELCKKVAKNNPDKDDKKILPAA